MRKVTQLALATVLAFICFDSTIFAQSKPTRIPYRVVEEWTIPNGGFGRVIVVDPKYRNEKDMRSLGGTLKQDTRLDRNAFVWIYDNERASKMHRKPPAQNTKDGRFYDQHFIGNYGRNINTGYHALGIMLNGVDGPMIEVKYK